ncbi:hypothetical protein CSIM01_02466 [Colletotrichum simmondsii]|uniref:DUF6536 domain-containing protein n=1 Tax=Colletotrichum simmondsii TaxID=703756 RepID=A0A135S7K9_9PEZI|nr:hypothetical protein CSIM01_02466 [Colletotrichum simmondsii]
MTFVFGMRGIIPQSHWKRSALAFAAAASITFAVNLCFVIWATTHSKETLSSDIGVVSSGNCQIIKRWNTGIHVVINIISTILLTGSNYCMQCLIAPTRAEIDSAHAQQEWLDIGVPSIRNFWSISWKRKVVWLLLATSSFPLHLLFNSVVFTSTSTNKYDTYAVSAEVFNGGDMSSPPQNLPKHLFPNPKDDDDREFVYLDNKTCIDQYGKQFQSSRGDLIVVGSNGTAFGGTAAVSSWEHEHWGGIEPAPFEWICDSEKPCDEKLSEVKAKSTWIISTGMEVQGCYSQKTEEHCKLMFSKTLCWIVTTLNLVKGILMLFVAYGNSERPLLNIGDAIESFLIEEDRHTRGMGLRSKAIQRKSGWWNANLQNFDTTRRRKFVAGSLCRWITCIAICLSAIIICILLLE